MASNGTGKGRAAGNTTADAVAPRRRKDVDPDPSSASTRSSRLAAEGVRTGEEFANLMSALMSDVIEGSIAPMVANAAVNAGGKLLKVVEMQYRYGSQKDQRAVSLTLAPG